LSDWLLTAALLHHSQQRLDGEREIQPVHTDPNLGSENGIGDGRISRAAEAGKVNAIIIAIVALLLFIIAAAVGAANPISHAAL
jgi:hypothetical protein